MRSRGSPVVYFHASQGCRSDALFLAPADLVHRGILPGPQQIARPAGRNDAGRRMLQRAQRWDIEMVHVRMRQHDQIDLRQFADLESRLDQSLNTQRDNGPRCRPARVLKTGSVMIVYPSIFISTVLCPSHAACRPLSGHLRRIGNLRSGRHGTPQLARVLLPESGSGLVNHRAGADDAHTSGAEQDAAAPTPFVVRNFVHQ